MWELIIAYMVGNNLERYTRQSEKDFTWDAIGDEACGLGAYEFGSNDGTWNAAFHNVVWFTETKVRELKDDGSEGEGEGEQAHPNDIMSTRVAPVAPWETGR